MWSQTLTYQQNQGEKQGRVTSVKPRVYYIAATFWCYLLYINDLFINKINKNADAIFESYVPKVPPITGRPVLAGRHCRQGHNIQARPKRGHEQLRPRNLQIRPRDRCHGAFRVGSREEHRAQNDDAYLSQHHIVEPVGVRASLTLLSYIECIYVFTLGFFSYKLYRPVGDGILYTLSIKYTTATFVAAMSNILPAATFVLACVFRSVDPSHSKT